MPGKTWAFLASLDRVGCNCSYPLSFIGSLSSFGKITDVSFVFVIFVRRCLSVIFMKCLLAPLSAFIIVFLLITRWAADLSLIVFKVFFNLFSTLLTKTGPTCQEMFLVLPPIRFCSVASFLWPSAGVWQSGLLWLQRPWVWQYFVR